MKTLNTSERRTVEIPVLRWARRRGILVLKLNLMGNCGYPDTLYLFQYPRMAFLEFKRYGAEPTDLQLERLTELRALGYAAHWCDNVAEAIDFLEKNVLNP